MFGLTVFSCAYSWRSLWFLKWTCILVIFRSPDILATLWSLYFLFFSLLVYFGHSNCGFLKVKQHWASSVLGWVTIWLGCSNPSIGTSFNFFFQILENFYQVFKNLQVLPKYEKSSNLTKFLKIFNFYQNFKNLHFTKIWKIFNFGQVFNFYQIFKNLQFLPKFEKSSILAKFSKIFILTKFPKIFNFHKIFKKLVTGLLKTLSPS